MFKGTITDVPGLLAGHYTDSVNQTGCTVVIAAHGAVAGVDVRGAAPGTRETDLLRPGNLVERIHAVTLTGGSAFGLDAAGGVMRYLEQQRIGLPVSAGIVPLVASAVLFDLDQGNNVRPDAQAGFIAAQAASAQPLAQGLVGAGTGATVGKLLGVTGRMSGGIGCASLRLPSGTLIAALIAVNAFGDVVDPKTGEILAGTRRSDGTFVNTFETLLRGGPVEAQAGTNTTIGIIATDARLSQGQAMRLASVAHDGLALTIRPVHTLVDGDTLFALSTGEREAEMIPLCAAAVEVTSRAIQNAILASQEDGAV